MQSFFNHSQLDNMSNEELVVLAKKNDEQSICILLERLRPIIQYDISLYIDDSLEVDDMLQEAHMAVLNAVTNYDVSKSSSFKTFAAVCINNRLLNFIKSKSAKQIVSQSGFTDLESSDNLPVNDSEIVNPENIFIDKEQYKLLREIIKNLLSALEYDVFECILEGKSYEETANKLGLNSKSVDNAMQRVRKKLRNILE